MKNKLHSIGLNVITVALVFLMTPGAVSAQNKLMNTDDKQTDKPAIVFLVAGQSNAKGAGALSPALHQKLGRDVKVPLIPGSTAQKVGIPIDSADYTHSYIWAPYINSFERINPRTNTRVFRDADNMYWHGMELPVVWELGKRFPYNDIYVIKLGVSATELFHDWNPEHPDSLYAEFLSYYTRGMSQLRASYTEIRVIGLYWDQGESDGREGKANKYEKNLTNFFSAVRRETDIPKLKIFVRKHLFNWDDIDIIIAAQQKVVAADSNSYLLDIDLGDRTKNYETWAYSPNNGHVSSKGFLELTKVLFDGPLKNTTIDSFEVYKK